jgi:hypothetical protein
MRAAGENLPHGKRPAKRKEAAGCEFPRHPSLARGALHLFPELNQSKHIRLRAHLVLVPARHARCVGERDAATKRGYMAGDRHAKDTPAEIVERLNKTINVGLADAKLKAKLAELGHLPMPMASAEFGKFVAAETEKWGLVVKAAGIKPQ